LIGSYALNAVTGDFSTANHIAATDNNNQLAACRNDRFAFFRQIAGDLRVDPKRVVTGKLLSRYFEYNALIHHPKPTRPSYCCL